MSFLFPKPSSLINQVLGKEDPSKQNNFIVHLADIPKKE